MSALQSQSSLLRFGFGPTKDTVSGLVDPNLSEFEPKPKPVSKRGPIYACCTVLLKSKQKFVVCQADRPVLKCIEYIAELADLH